VIQGKGDRSLSEADTVSVSSSEHLKSLRELGLQNARVTQQNHRRSERESAVDLIRLTSGRKSGADDWGVSWLYRLPFLDRGKVGGKAEKQRRDTLKKAVILESGGSCDGSV